MKHNRDGGFLEKSRGENLENCVEGVLQAKSFFCDENERVSRHGNPDLSFDGIG